MSKTKIEWADYSLNPVKGLCPMACSYCYARRMYNTPYYKALYNHRKIELVPAVFNDLPKMKPGSKVFWGSTMELFGAWINPVWIELIMSNVKLYPELTHIFLTKRPENLIKWSPFPENCWVGMSATSAMDCIVRLPAMAKIEASLKFISFEPLLKPITSPNQLYIMLKLSGINLVIIGQQTPVKKSTTPKIEWIQEIVEAADGVGIPVFEKNNLKPLLGDNLRQEFPCDKEHVK